jgi:hypothetical protein
MENRAKFALDFLHDPVVIGTNYIRVVIDGTQILKLWEFLQNYAKKNHKSFPIKKPHLDLKGEEVAEAKKWNLPKCMEEMLNFLLKTKMCPPQVTKWSTLGVDVLSPEYDLEEKFEYAFLSPKAYVPESFDAFSIEIETGAYPNLVLDFISLTSSVLKEFKDFILSIPIVGEHTVFSSICQKHAAKYVSVLYPAVVALWADFLANYTTSEDQVELLSSALDYFYTREWRTSILLTAISMEKLVAELFEELFKKPCPPFPIGSIFKRISKSKPLPKDIELAVKTTNRIRIAAVHRSYMPLGIKEATEALSGAMTFLFWYQENGSNFCCNK